MVTSQFQTNLVSNLISLASNGQANRSRKIAKELDIEMAIEQINQHLSILNFNMSSLIVVGLCRALKEHSVDLLRDITELLKRVSDQTFNVKKNKINSKQRKSFTKKLKQPDTSLLDFDVTTIDSDKIKNIHNDDFESFMANELTLGDLATLRFNDDQIDPQEFIMSPLTPMISGPFNTDMNKSIETSHVQLDVPDIDFEPDIPNPDIFDNHVAKASKIGENFDSSMHARQSIHSLISMIPNKLELDRSKNKAVKHRGVIIDKITEIRSSTMKALISDTNGNCKQSKKSSDQEVNSNNMVLGNDSNCIGFRMNSQISNLTDSMTKMSCFLKQKFQNAPVVVEDASDMADGTLDDVLRNFFEVSRMDESVMFTKPASPLPNNDCPPGVEFNAPPDIDFDIPDAPTMDFEENQLGKEESHTDNKLDYRFLHQECSKRNAAISFYGLLRTLNNPKENLVALQEAPFAPIVIKSSA